MQRSITLTPDRTGCPADVAGTFRFEARLSNIGEHSLSDLVVVVTTLTHDNLLHNADGGPGGVGTPLTVPQAVEAVLSIASGRGIAGRMVTSRGAQLHPEGHAV